MIRENGLRDRVFLRGLREHSSSSLPSSESQSSAASSVSSASTTSSSLVDEVSPSQSSPLDELFASSVLVVVALHPSLQSLPDVGCSSSTGAAGSGVAGPGDVGNEGTAGHPRARTIELAELASRAGLHDGLHDQGVGRPAFEPALALVAAAPDATARRMRVASPSSTAPAERRGIPTPRSSQLPRHPAFRVLVAKPSRNPRATGVAFGIL